MKRTAFLITLFFVLSFIFSGMILAQAKNGVAITATAASVWDYL
jgi:preprotein translocase subunit SecG